MLIMEGLPFEVESGFGNEENKRASVFSPHLVAFDHQIEKQLPMFCIAMSVEHTPRLIVVGRRRPSSCLEENEQIFMRNCCACHCPW